MEEIIMIDIKKLERKAAEIRMAVIDMIMMQALATPFHPYPIQIS